MRLSAGVCSDADRDSTEIANTLKALMILLRNAFVGCLPELVSLSIAFQDCRTFYSAKRAIVKKFKIAFSGSSSLSTLLNRRYARFPNVAIWKSIPSNAG